MRQQSLSSMCDTKATPDDDDDDDGGGDDDDDGSLLGALWWMRIDVTHVELCVPTYVSVYERRQTIPGLQHTQTHTFWWAVLHCSYPLPHQQCSPGLFRSLMPLRGSNPPPPPPPHTPPVWPTIPMPPLSSYFLSSFSVSLSLINVKPFNNKADILPLPASSVPRICHCALTLPLAPTQRPPSSFHMAAELKNPGPHCQHERLFRGSVRNREKSEEETFLSLLSFRPPFSFLPSCGRGIRREAMVIYIIHGRHRRKRPLSSKKKKFGWSGHWG